MNYLRKIFCLLIIISGFISGQAIQTEIDSANFIIPNNGKLLRSSFDKQLNTANLQTSFYYDLDFDKWNLWLTEDFQSTVIKSKTHNIKDEQYFSLGGAYKITKQLNAGLKFKNSIYSDDRNLGFNEAIFTNTVGFLNYQPMTNVSIVPYGGISINQQVGERDQGALYGIEGKANNVYFTDFFIDASFNLQNEDIAPRKNTLRYFDINIDNNFENSIFNVITTNYAQQRKDFYFDADSIISETYGVTNNIQARTETNYYLQDRLMFSVPNSNMQAAVQARVGWRNIDRATRYRDFNRIDINSFDTKIEEFRLDLGANLQYRWNSGFGRFNLTYAEREESHSAKDIADANRFLYEERNRLEQQKSNRSQLLTLAFSGSKYFSSSDKISFSFFHRKLLYDTPSSENDDDRDELLTLVKAGYSKSLSRFFNVFMNLEGSLNHIVYIYAARSANNNRTRSIKLSSGGQYTGKHVRSTNIAEVSANYTTYDFEKINPLLKSFSFRQYSFKDSSIIKFLDNVDGKIYGYVRLSEQGDFNWDDFSGTPSRFLEEIYLEPQLVYNYYALSFGMGIRYFSLATYLFNKKNERYLQSHYRSIGPLTEINYNIGSKIGLRLYGYYEFITTAEGQKRELSNLNLSVFWNI